MSKINGGDSRVKSRGEMLYENTISDDVKHTQGPYTMLLYVESSAFPVRKSFNLSYYSYIKYSI